MLEKEIKISFCTVTYNNQSEISQLIENVESLSSKIFSFKIFVVDNGSSDNTVSIVKNLKQQYDNIQLVIPDENKGFGAGNNAVLSLIDSDYHILVNPDVYIDSASQIDSMIQYMEKHPEAGLLSPKILNEDGTIQKLYKHNPTVLDMALRFISPNLMKKRQSWFVHDESGYVKIGKIEHASGAFMFFRTSVFKRVSGFDERYFMYMEDADITRKVNSISKSVFFPYSSVTHEWQRTSHKNIKFMWMTIISMYKYFNKWGWKFF